MRGDIQSFQQDSCNIMYFQHYSKAETEQMGHKGKLIASFITNDEVKECIQLGNILLIVLI